VSGLSSNLNSHEWLRIGVRSGRRVGTGGLAMQIDNPHRAG